MENDHIICIKNCEIRYRELGDGPFLFLVHGIAGFLEEWAPAMKILSERYHVVAMDLPGHGMSGKPEIQYTIEQLTVYLAGFISAFTTEKTLLAGHSLGGSVCLNLAFRRPGMIERLVLVNSAFEVIPFSVRLGALSCLPHLIKKVPAWLVKSFLRKSIHKRERITPHWIALAYRYINTPGNLRAMFSIIRSNITFTGIHQKTLEHFKKGLNRIHIPVLILCSEYDRILPHKNSVLLHQSLKNAKYVFFKNCGHELQYEDYEKFCREVSSFLSNPSS